MPIPEPTTSLPQNGRISLIIPALNEEDVIEKTVQDVVAQVKGHFSEYEIILVNDGSTDTTGEIMDRLASEHSAIRVLHNPCNKGLGFSYRKGVHEARFEYVMLLCGDGGLPAESLPPIFNAVGTVDIVVPYMKNLRNIKTPVRYLLSRTYTSLLNLLFRQKLQYYNGLQVHRLALLRQIDITSTGFAFQAEILIKLLKAGCSYVEVGVLGAEKTHRSNAVTIKNFVTIGKTLILLIWEILFFPPNRIKRETFDSDSTGNWRERDSKDQVTTVA